MSGGRPNSFGVRFTDVYANKGGTMADGGLAVHPPARSDLEQIRHRLAIAGDRRQMLGGAASGDALVVVAGIGRVRGQVGDPGRFPELDLAPPVLRAAGAGRNPDFEPIAAGSRPASRVKPRNFSNAASAASPGG